MDLITAVELGKSAFDLWSLRQRKRLDAHILSELGRLKSRIDAMPDASKTQMDALIGKALATSMQDAREFKQKLLAACLTGAAHDEIAFDSAELLLGLIDRLQPAHCVVLRWVADLPRRDPAVASGGPDMVTYEDLEKESRRRNVIDEEALWLMTNDLVQMNILKTRLRASERAKAIRDLSMHRLLRLQAFSLTAIGNDLIQRMPEINPSPCHDG